MSSSSTNLRISESFESPEVAVVMSTYNGDRFLSPQIDSIMNQTNVDVQLYVRDDGSHDSTLDILNDYAMRYDNIHYVSGENIGWRKSFIAALDLIGSEPYIAFADQDDVWLEAKLATGVTAVRKTEKLYPNQPILYAGNVYITDENLNVMGTFNKKPIPIEEMELPETFAYDHMAGGLTYVFNRVARDLLLNCEHVGVTGHDRMAVLCCKAFGHIIYDFDSYVYYRQHGDNAMGVRGTPLSNLPRRVLKYLRKTENNCEVASNLLSLSSTIPFLNKSMQSFCGDVANYKKSLDCKRRLICSSGFTRHSAIEDVKMRLMVLRNVY